MNETIATIEAWVFSTDIVALGVINEMTALRWTQRFSNIGDFELTVPLTDENAELIQLGNLVWIGTDELGVIEVIQKQKSEEDGSITLSVSGRFNECWLERRIVWDSYKEENIPVSDHMRNLLDLNVINPANGDRRISNIALENPYEAIGAPITFGAHRDNLWESITDLSAAHKLWARFSCSVRAKTCTFTVRKGTDRSREQSDNIPVVLSSELSDILSSDYSADLTSYCDMALIAGAGEGSERKLAEVGSELSGLDRRELYVDARDLQDYETWDYITTRAREDSDSWETKSGKTMYRVTVKATKKMTSQKTGEVKYVYTRESYTWSDVTPSEDIPTNEEMYRTEEGTEDIPYPDDVYKQMLVERGMAKLAEVPKIEAFNSTVRMTGARAYTFGEDYFLGDRITVEDKDLKVQISTEVTEYEQTWDEQGYTVLLTLGNAAPTITELVKKRS